HHRWCTSSALYHRRPESSCRGGAMMEIAGPRAGFHAALDTIMRDITRMAAHVTESVPKGTFALLDNDLTAAQEVIDSDDVVDDLALEVEERCYELLVLEAPVASDMRAIITALRLVAEVERSADLMVNVCKATRRIYPAELPPPVRGL